MAEKQPEGAAILDAVYAVIQDRQQHPKDGSYTTYLLTEGVDKILKKVGEETSEVIIAAKNSDEGELVYEVGDLLYHLLVLLAAKGVAPEQIYAELRSRR